MWIRTQDKEILGSFKVFYIDENMSDEIVIIGCDGHVHVNDKVVSLFELGTYKSRERALEVLDDISKQLSINKAIEICSNLGDMTQANRENYIYTQVYQMPKE